jgi:ADP-heptose:LPS heptosyltransferase
VLRSGGGPELLRVTKYEIVRFTRGRGLDIGRGPFKAYPHFVGVREEGDKTLNPLEAADFSCPSFKAGLEAFDDATLDFVFAWGDDLGIEDEWVERILKDCGTYIRAGWKVQPTDKEAGVPWITFNRWLGGQWLVIDMSRPEGKTACVCRYGAMGDMLQVSSILPQLKKDGYHVTVMCHPDGKVVLENDPNIDEFLVQDRDQVPNGELLPYWDAVSKKFDRWININGTCEGPLLAVPGRENHRFPDSVRRKYMNLNYLEFMAEVAELPYVPGLHFYPTAEEESAAAGRIKSFEGVLNKSFVIGQKFIQPYVIMWVLSGSSVHKFWPHQDAVIARIMLEIPNACIMFVGDNACKMLEAGWENEQRIQCLSGELSIRETLALAQQCQLVVGPETGILNGVSFESMAKVVFLSHSTEQNLTRDWVNTEGLHSTTTPCYPCHRLHYNRDFCPEDAETGAAQCQKDLHPSTVWEAIQRAYTGWGTLRSLMQA